MDRGRPRQPQICCSSMCRREILPHEKGTVITMFGETFGMGERQKSKAQRLHLCPKCALRVALDKEPAKTAPVDLAFFRILLDLSGQTRNIAEATFEQLHERRRELLYPPALPEPEIIPPSRALKAAG
jgi:hypothetical protein